MYSTEIFCNFDRKWFSVLALYGIKTPCALQKYFVIFEQKKVFSSCFVWYKTIEIRKLLPLAKRVCYIYIYIERERERERRKFQEHIVNILMKRTSATFKKNKKLVKWLCLKLKSSLGRVAYDSVFSKWTTLEIALNTSNCQDSETIRHIVCSPGLYFSLWLIFLNS